MTTLTATVTPALETSPADAAPYSSRKAIWGARIMKGISVAFLTMDASMKLLQIPLAFETSAELGWSPDSVLLLGVIEAVALVLYLVPRTSVFGALLWTGYLGGAVATHLRVGNPLASHTLFPIYIAILLWGALWLRNADVRKVFGFGR